MTEEKPKILVVDDELSIRILLEHILTDAGYDVIIRANGPEALSALEDDAIRLVLLDVNMPGMSGFEALNLIREKSGVPVIMVTGVGEVTSLSSALTLGADDYVTKPFRSRELLARIAAKIKRAGA